MTPWYSLVYRDASPDIRRCRRWGEVGDVDAEEEEDMVVELATAPTDPCDRVMAVNIEGTTVSSTPLLSQNIVPLIG